MRTASWIIVFGLVLTFGCGDGNDAPAPTATPLPLTPTPTPTATETPAVRADPPCSFDGRECQGFCFTGRCIYDPGGNACICQEAFDLACDQFALGACGGHACFGPGQTCVVVDDRPGVPPCGCIASEEAGSVDGPSVP